MCKRSGLNFKRCPLGRFFSITESTFCILLLLLLQYRYSYFPTFTTGLIRENNIHKKYHPNQRYPRTSSGKMVFQTFALIFAASPTTCRAYPPTNSGTPTPTKYFRALSLLQLCAKAMERLVIGACEGVDGLQCITYDNNLNACPPP